ncbi:hypothetical protein [Haloactinopolyspora sp.]|uniref:hypothetical protein n=1 Tax=Haloactinopolyspora sp. TaxID=1966353 RepID=UPI00260D43F4|nr:hypothetical protein [Haloactinopolyspora sp.]
MITYALMTQRISSNDATRPDIMLGIAMLTIVTSSSVMKKPRHSVSRIAQGLPRQRFIVASLIHPSGRSCPCAQH